MGPQFFNMHASKIIFSLLAAYVAAQEDSDSPDSPTDTAGTAVASSSGLATRLSYVTYTTTNVGTIVTSSIGTSRFITSLPPSLSTYTTQIPLETTLVPVLTPSVISGTTVVTTNTAGQGETTIVGGETISPTTTLFSTPDAAASSTSTAGGAAVTVAHGLVGAAAWLCRFFVDEMLLSVFVT